MKKYLFIVLLGFIPFWGCDDNQLEEVDTISPNAVVTNPVENEYVNGIISVTCMASDNEGIERVELWVDGLYTGLVDIEEPYVFEWSTADYDDNTFHSLIARAIDINGNVTDSEPVKVTVIQNTDILVIRDLIDLNYLNIDLFEFVNSYCSFTNINGNSRLRSLYLNNYENNKIFILPESFGTLNYLEHFYIPNQSLTSLPESLVNLNNLKVLDLSSNQLTSLPDSFGNLIGLTTLYLEYNQLTSLPDSFGNLIGLTTLYLDNNQLTSLPATFCNLNYDMYIRLYNNMLYCNTNWISCIDAFWNSSNTYSQNCN